MATEDSNKAKDDLLPRVIADAAAAAAGLPLGPAGTFLTAAAAPYLEVVAQWAWDKFGEDSTRRILGMLGRAWHATGLSSVSFASRIGRDEQTRLLTASAIRGASSTAWPPRVKAIGDLLARGLLTDDEVEIDLVAYGLAAMAEMERPHVSLLDLLVNYTPYFTAAAEKAAPYVPQESSSSGPWHADNRKWTAYQIAAIRPRLKPALEGLMGTLIRHGLAVEDNGAAHALQESLRGFEQRANEQAGQMMAGSRLTASTMRPHVPKIPRIIRSWSPTELGEQILGLYGEAAKPEK